MPGNSKKNGKANGLGKNQVALDNDDRGTFQSVDTPKNAVVLGTDGNVEVTNAASGALDTLLMAIADQLEGYEAAEVRQALIDIGVIDDSGTDDTAQIGDVVDLGDGNDVMWGDDNQVDTTGNDIILGGDGNDQLRGDGGNDALFGEAGNDVLNGDEGDDYMAGGTGNDVYHVDSEGDIVVENEDEGEDSIVWRIPESTLDLGAFPNIENGTLHKDAGASDLVGNEENNVLIGNNFDNEISGLGGDDTILGLGGDDTIDGGDGDDTIDGGAGTDVLVGGDGADTIFSGDGGDDDTVNVGTGAADGRDGDVDVIVAAASFAENGTDTIFNYEESTFSAALPDDIFDFSAFIDLTDPLVDDDVELADFLTFVEDSTDPVNDASTIGEIRDVPGGNTWFVVNELGAGNPAESVTVRVDGTDFVWNTVSDEWDFA